MAASASHSEITPDQRRDEQIRQYWAGDLSRRVYLFRRQRKAVLENCRRIAVIGASTEPNSPSFITFERLLGLRLEMIPVFPDRESFLGLRCYKSLRDIPGQVDIVQIYPTANIDMMELARAAVDQGVSTFWLEKGTAASQEVEDILSAGKVQLIEYETLEQEYLKHIPVVPGSPSRRRDKKSGKVRDRMSKAPITVQPNDTIKDAMDKMEHSHVRHLPVVDEKAKLIGMLTDRDIRLIHPSLTFVNPEDAAIQLGSIVVHQAAMFDPVSVKPEATLKETAELMLRWRVGGLPVVDGADKVVGVITYTDILREFAGREELQSAMDYWSGKN